MTTLNRTLLRVLYSNYKNILGKRYTKRDILRYVKIICIFIVLIHTSGNIPNSGYILNEYYFSKGTFDLVMVASNRSTIFSIKDMKHKNKNMNIIKT